MTARCYPNGGQRLEQSDDAGEIWWRIDLWPPSGWRNVEHITVSEHEIQMEPGTNVLPAPKNWIL